MSVSWVIYSGGVFDVILCGKRGDWAGNRDVDVWVRANGTDGEGGGSDGAHDIGCF